MSQGFCQGFASVHGQQGQDQNQCSSPTRHGDIVSLADGRWLVMAAKRGRRSVSVAGRGCGSRTI